MFSTLKWGKVHILELGREVLNTLSSRNGGVVPSLASLSSLPHVHEQGGESNRFCPSVCLFDSAKIARYGRHEL